MAPPKNTLWNIEPHTIGKHLVLRAYLDAWLPILSSWKKRILFIDGFAGPGEYTGGEEGSPQIALRALADHTAKLDSEVVFIFIEKDAKRSKHLEKIVDEWKGKLPKSAGLNVQQGAFDETMTEVLDWVDDQKKRLAPAFVMIDPFGVAGTPMSVVHRILKNPQCEIYFSLMYEALNRFRNTPEFEPHLDELFGCSEWRDCVDINDPEERRIRFYGLYEEQLRKGGAKHVVNFDIYNGNRLIYTIFFASQHEVGCDRMKAAIWKIAPRGNYQFRGTKKGQLTLTLDPDYEPLRLQLREEFGDGEWHSIEKIQEFIRSDKTDYHSGQLKVATLKPMEAEGFVEADPSTRKRAGTYPPKCRLRFKPTNS